VLGPFFAGSQRRGSGNRTKADLRVLTRTLIPSPQASRVAPGAALGMLVLPFVQRLNCLVVKLAVKPCLDLSQSTILSRLDLFRQQSLHL